MKDIVPVVVDVEGVENHEPGHREIFPVFEAVDGPGVFNGQSSQIFVIQRKLHLRKT